MGFLTAAAGTFSVGDTLYKLAVESGFAGLVVDGGWRNLVMIVIACVLLYLGIVKGFEPLLHLSLRLPLLLLPLPAESRSPPLCPAISLVSMSPPAIP